MSQKNPPIQGEQASQPNPVQIKATDEKLKGEYSNFANIFHTKEEFVIDFMNLFAQTGNMFWQTGTLNSRVIVSPGHFKRILEALQKNLSRYESQFGNVTPSAEPKSSIGFQAEE